LHSYIVPSTTITGKTKVDVNTKIFGKYFNLKNFREYFTENCFGDEIFCGCNDKIKKVTKHRHSTSKIKHLILEFKFSISANLTHFF